VQRYDLNLSGSKNIRLHGLERDHFQATIHIADMDRPTMRTTQSPLARHPSETDEP